MLPTLSSVGPVSNTYPPSSLRTFPGSAFSGPTPGQPAARRTSRFLRHAVSMEFHSSCRLESFHAPTPIGKSGGPTEPTELVISDSEWAAHRMAEERGIEHARLATELLTRAHDQFKQQSSSSTAAARNRLYAHLIAQMAGEYMQLLDYSNARR